MIKNLNLLNGKKGVNPYLIESNPLYTNYANFIGSDYMMSQLNYRPEKTIQRLGDSMYETTLVRNSIIKLSGKRYLSGYGSDLQQFQALMDNALSVKDDLNLALGITLSKEQIASLSKDIVWMEERTIEGQRVLVPVVYLSSLNANDMRDGAIIKAGENLSLVATGKVKNQGSMSSDKDLTIQADNILNQGGKLLAKLDLILNSKTNIENISGNIQAGQNVQLTAKNDISIKASQTKKTYNNGSGYQTVTNKGQVATLIAGKNISVHAGNSVELLASKIKAREDVTLTSTNKDVSINSLAMSEDYNFNTHGGYNKGNSVTNMASSIQGNNVNINAQAEHGN